MGHLATPASLLSLETSHQGGSAGSPPCLSSCTSSTSSSLALQLQPPPNLTQKQWCPSNWAIARPTLSRNAELALSSTKSLMRNPASSIFCNEHLHAMPSLTFASFPCRTETFNFYR